MKLKNYLKVAKMHSKGHHKGSLVKSLCWISNRSLYQTLELLALCDEDFTVLMELEAKMKKHFIFFCPIDRKEINHILSLKL